MSTIFEIRGVLLVLWHVLSDALTIFLNNRTSLAFEKFPISISFSDGFACVALCVFLHYINVIKCVFARKVNGAFSSFERLVPGSDENVLSKWVELYK